MLLGPYLLTCISQFRNSAFPEKEKQCVEGQVSPSVEEKIGLRCLKLVAAQVAYIAAACITYIEFSFFMLVHVVADIVSKSNTKMDDRAFELVVSSAGWATTACLTNLFREKIPETIPEFQQHYVEIFKMNDPEEVFA